MDACFILCADMTAGRKLLLSVSAFVLVLGEKKMEPILACQSVEIKCRIKASILMGNYEFYYAGGRLCALAGVNPDRGMMPEEFYAFLEPLFDTYEVKNEEEEYLVKMLRGYKVLGEYDEQMRELMEMGVAGVG